MQVASGHHQEHARVPSVDVNLTEQVLATQKFTEGRQGLSLRTGYAVLASVYLQNVHLHSQVHNNPSVGWFTCYDVKLVPESMDF